MNWKELSEKKYCKQSASGWDETRETEETNWKDTISCWEIRTESSLSSNVTEGKRWAFCASFHFNALSVQLLQCHVFNCQHSKTVAVQSVDIENHKTWSPRNFITVYDSWPCIIGWTLWLLFLASEPRHAKAFNLRFNSTVFFRC